MPETIASLHTLFTVIAVGLLFGLGFLLAQLIVAWPASRVAGGAAVVGACVLILAWLV